MMAVETAVLETVETAVLKAVLEAVLKEVLKEVLEEAPVAPRSSRAVEPGARLALKVQQLRSGGPCPDRARMGKNQPGSTWRKRGPLKSSPPTSSTSPT